jgi:DNA adenine methylase
MAAENAESALSTVTRVHAELLGETVASGVATVLSYDGATGDKVYGPPLPADLGLRHLALPAGRSAQATLLGRDEQTVESLWVSTWPRESVSPE